MQRDGVNLSFYAFSTIHANITIDYMYANKQLLLLHELVQNADMSDKIWIPVTKIHCIYAIGIYFIFI